MTLDELIEDAVRLRERWGGNIPVEVHLEACEEFDEVFAAAEQITIRNEQVRRVRISCE
jgi:hypothetical protein